MHLWGKDLLYAAPPQKILYLSEFINPHAQPALLFFVDNWSILAHSF